MLLIASTLANNGVRLCKIIPKTTISLQGVKFEVILKILEAERPRMTSKNVEVNRGNNRRNKEVMVEASKDLNWKSLRIASKDG